MSSCANIDEYLDGYNTVMKVILKELRAFGQVPEER